MSVEKNPVEGWSAPSAKERLDLLKRTKTIAMVGVSAKKSRPSNFVATYLLSSSADFEVFFVVNKSSDTDFFIGRSVNIDHDHL